MKNYLTIKEELRFLFEILKPYKLAVILFLIGSLVASVFDGISIGLLIPLLSRLQGMQAADKLPNMLQWLANLPQPYSVEKQLAFWIGLVVIAVLIKNVLIGYAFKKGLWLSSRVTADLRLRAIKMLLSVGIDFHHKSKVGTFIEKTINNTQMLRELIVFSIQFIVFLLTLLVLIFLMIILSWQLAVLALFLGMIVAAIISLYIKPLYHLGLENATNNRELTSAVQENMSAIQLIKSYNKEHDQMLMLSGKVHSCLESENLLSYRSSWVQPLTEGFGIIAIGILLIITFTCYPMDRKLLLTQLIPFLYILTRIVPTLKILNESKGIITARSPYLRLVYDFLRTDNKPFITEGQKDFLRLKRRIHFQSVTFSYDNDNKYALKEVNFAIPFGKTTAIVGESGAGKSTIVNLLLRFYDPQKGAILIDDLSIRDFRIATFRRKIGVVSQEAFIFNETVKYNIAFGMEEELSDEHIIEAAKKAGAHNFILELPDGYNTFLGDRGIRLSGGQRQRISIARAVLKDPEILILDEATGSLDSATEQLIHNAILSLSKDRTVIIIAHRISTIRNADQIIVLKQGRVIETGSAEQLLAREGEYFRLANV